MMRESVMTQAAAPDVVETISPRRIARMIGVLTLLTVLGGVFAQGYVSERLIVWRDAAITGANILAHRNLYLSGLTTYLVEMTFSVATVALMYVLLRPAGPSLSLTAAFIGLTACIIKTMGRVLFAAPLYVLTATHRVHTLSADTLNDLSLILLLVNDHAAGIAMAFFGFQSVLHGVLILRSTFLPRWLGVFAIVGGIGWLTHLWPPLGYRMEDYLMIVALLGVAVTTFWLLVFGVDERRWHEQADESRL